MTKPLVSPGYFLNHIIMKIPREMGMGSPAAEKALFMTAAHESGDFHHVRQVKGPALGLFQMEPTTFLDIYDRYLVVQAPRRRQLVDRYLIEGDGVFVEQLVCNHRFSCAMARIKFAMDRESFPDVGDTAALADYIKRVWNTEDGKAKASDYVEAYQRCVPQWLKPKEW